MIHSERRRSRAVYALLILLVICLGLASRSKQISLPGFIAAYAGDALWALTAFFGIGFLLPPASTAHVAALAAAFSFAIEISQFYHAPWLDALRRTGAGALVLGHGFLWSDLACYAVGIAIGVFIERMIELRKSVC